MKKLLRGNSEGEKWTEYPSSACQLVIVANKRIKELMVDAMEESSRPTQDAVMEISRETTQCRRTHSWV